MGKILICLFVILISSCFEKRYQEPVKQEKIIAINQNVLHGYAESSIAGAMFYFPVREFEVEELINNPLPDEYTDKIVITLLNQAGKFGIPRNNIEVLVKRDSEFFYVLFKGRDSKSHKKLVQFASEGG